MDRIDAPARLDDCLVGYGEVNAAVVPEAVPVGALLLPVWLWDRHAEAILELFHIMASAGANVS